MGEGGGKLFTPIQMLETNCNNWREEKKKKDKAPIIAIRLLAILMLFSIVKTVNVVPFPLADVSAFFYVYRKNIILA